jgi:BCD family chlorophyll transporter-like MFS transporter
MEIYAILRGMNWRRVLQLALVHVGVSITVVPVTSTLNRIMIADMGMSALWVSILVSLQVWVGNWADRYPIGGRYRAPWIVLGGLMASFGSYLTAHAVYLLHAQPGWGALAALGSFTLWGVGVNVASVSYLSLLSDLTHDATRWRSRTVSLMWTAMILSTIATALGLAAMLDPFSEEALYNAFGLVWMIASVLVLVGAGGLEPAATGRKIQHSAGHPHDAVRALAGNPTARRFFVYLLLVLLSIRLGPMYWGCRWHRRPGWYRSGASASLLRCWGVCLWCGVLAKSAAPTGGRRWSPRPLAASSPRGWPGCPRRLWPQSCYWGWAAA